MNFKRNLVAIKRGLARLSSQIQKWLRRLIRDIPDWFEALFVREPRPRARWVFYIWFLALFGAGVYFWGAFFNWGNINFNWHDWAEVTAPRVAFVGNSLRQGELPLHMTDSSALRGVTDRYLAIPDVMISPQMLLLLFLDVGQFFLFNTLLLYTLGALGLLWIARRYKLSALAVTPLFLLFNFNGHITAHLSVGHENWVGYFLFPWIVGLLLLLAEGRSSWRFVAVFSGLLFFLLLQGAYHQLVWCLLLLALVGLFNWKTLVTVIKVGFFTGLLSLVRLLPPALELGHFDTSFISGYPSLLNLLQSMVTVQPATDALEVRMQYNSLGWWELDLYIGLIGLAFLLIFGLGGWLHDLHNPDGRARLLAPVTVMAVLAIGPLWGWMIKILPIPLLTSERVSARVISLPFVILLVLAAIYFQDFIDNHVQEYPARWSLLMPVLPMGLELWSHFQVWRVSAALKGFPTTPVNLAIKVPANHPDPPYFAALAAGLAVTLLTALFLLYQVWRERPQTEAVMDRYLGKT
jgi:hypothetical protein